LISPSTLSWRCHVPSSKGAYGHWPKSGLSRGVQNVGSAAARIWAAAAKIMGVGSKKCATVAGASPELRHHFAFNQFKYRVNSRYRHDA
jgi:hypothetical protein